MPDSDNLITKTKFGNFGFRYSTGSYLRDEAIFYKKENVGAIALAMKYNLELSPKTLDRLERDSGMLNVLKNCLTTENFNELSAGGPIFLDVFVTMTLDGSVVTGHSFSISNGNIDKIQFSPQEIDRLFDYFKQIKIIYTGKKEFEGEIVPVGWIFPVRKNDSSFLQKHSTDTVKKTFTVIPITGDSLLMETDSALFAIRYSTRSFKRDEAIFNEKENRREISIAMKNHVEVSLLTLDMIERDGGMMNVLKNCLTTENFNELNKDLNTMITLRATMALDGSTVTGRSVSIGNRNFGNVHLSPQEVDKLFNYCKQFILVYTGKQYRNENAVVSRSFLAEK